MLFDFIKYMQSILQPSFFSIGGGRSQYEIDKSLRFRASASAYLNRTPGVAGNTRTFTVSLWVKRGALTSGGTFGMFEANGGANELSSTSIGSDIFRWQELSVAATYNLLWTTSAVFRDASAWYHLVIVFDSTQASSANCVKLYVNGVQQTLTFQAVSGAYVQNRQSYFNRTVAHRLGVYNGLANYFDGYMSEINFIDGLALDASYFGETDSTTGAWVPKRYAGSYGTNGFYLGFSDGTSLTTLGNDESSNNNDWTLNNISITAGTTYDWMDDTPTNNFPILNPLRISANQLLSQGSLLSSQTANTFSGALATFSLDNGKWYWETVLTARTGTVNVYNGIAQNTFPTTQYAGATSDSYGYLSQNGQKYNNAVATAYGASYTVNDVLGFTYDSSTGTLTCYKNNVSQGALVTGLTGTWFPVVSYSVAAASSASQAVNFGQRPFTYTPPAGFKALCTRNLPVPTVKRGDKYFDVNLRTGNGSTFSVTGIGFSPDLIWTKGRSTVSDHSVYDSVRGATKQIEPSNNTGETTEATGITAFTSDGFSGGALAQINTNAATYVDWLWKEAPAILDIVTYTGTGVARTVAHDLGVVPAMIIVKDLVSGSWIVYHKNNTAAPETDYLVLESTAITVDDVLAWNDTAPTSSVFTVGAGGDVNANGVGYVAYLFAEMPGFSKFDAYLGNGSADGPFVWCGFRPKWVLIKRYDVSAAAWLIYDTERGGFNLIDDYLLTTTAAETSLAGLEIDILSNGFKLRGNQGTQNASGSNYIVAAFAETPFKYANAR